MCSTWCFWEQGHSISASVLSVFLEQATGVSQHPLSCWINIRARSIPGARAAEAASISLQCCVRRAQSLHPASTARSVPTRRLQGPVEKNDIIKGNRLILTTSCLQRQEVVTVALLLLSSHVLMFSVYRSALTSQQQTQSASINNSWQMLNKFVGNGVKLCPHGD